MRNQTQHITLGKRGNRNAKYKAGCPVFSVSMSPAIFGTYVCQERICRLSDVQIYLGVLCSPSLTLASLLEKRVGSSPHLDPESSSVGAQKGRAVNEQKLDVCVKMLGENHCFPEDKD